MIELRHLRYAVAVADEGHLTRAAERLGIQQPPLSQQIRALEDRIGVRLFSRLPRGMQPTEAGRVLVERARLILQEVDLAVAATGRTGRGEQGDLAIGFTSSAAFHALVTTVVRGMRQHSPAVTLKLEEGSTVDLIEALRLGRLDAAFVRTPLSRLPAQLTIEPLLDEEMLLALPDQHRRAARGRAPPGRGAARIALATLADEDFILYRRPTGPGLYDRIIAACRAAGFSPRVAQEAPQLVSTLSLVAAGLGVSIVPESIARLEMNGVTYRRLDGAAGLAAPLHLAYRNDEDGGARRRFVQYVREKARAATGNASR